MVLELPMMDGLSFPLTFLWALKSLVTCNIFTPEQILRKKNLRVIVVGASKRAEERLFDKSNYWEELIYFLPQSNIELVFVGPEISKEKHKKSFQNSPKLKAFFFKGSFGQYLNYEKSLIVDDTILVGFNTGFGSGDENLRKSFSSDLQIILKRKFLMVFTCSNDHSDLNGEEGVINQIGGKFVLYPRKSPFAAVTVTHVEGQKDSTWSSANSFVYCLQGYTEEKEQQIQEEQQQQQLQKLQQQSSIRRKLSQKSVRQQQDRNQ
eukprot:TRINITY_DN31054_c0_g1_i2.p1 TRINITY_DN31054_c0_g1~~TRINITY_DN31054_c0_g1_i2.p1  ORF type:complete len:302 (-),score=47.93 TRINITY_DN31054_c0_g1_i2:43-834(-)